MRQVVSNRRSQLRCDVRRHTELTDCRSQLCCDVARHTDNLSFEESRAVGTIVTPEM